VKSADQNGRSAPTLEEVAALAGVSRATASRVINGAHRASPEAVAAVNEAIKKLDYVPNRAARALASRQTHAIALIVPEEADRFFGDPFFASIVGGITSRIQPTDYVLNLIIGASDMNRKTARYLAGGNVDGALVVSQHGSNALLEMLPENVPVVFGGQPLDDPNERAYYVDVDNVAGARTAVQHLVKLGRKRIATITGPMDMHASRDRLTGWQQVLSEAGLELLPIEHGDFTGGSGAAAMRRILEHTPDLDAVFVASDLMAAGAVTVLRERGFKVPDDVAVMGYDNSPVSVRGDIKLSTIAQPSAQMGREMVDMLLGLLGGKQPPARGRILETSLILRDSAPAAD